MSVVKCVPVTCGVVCRILANLVTLYFSISSYISFQYLILQDSCKEKQRVSHYSYNESCK